MNQIKKILGFVWIGLGPAVMIFMFWQAADKIGLAQATVSAAVSESARKLAQSIAINTILQWSIIILVFLPVACGMIIFGKYAISGEYDHLPQVSEEVD